MKVTICRLDASFFLTERTIAWIMQSMHSFLTNVGKDDLRKANLGASTAYAYYARAAYDSRNNASNLSFQFDKKYLFSPDKETVKGMDNPNTLSSWCRLMGFIYDDDGTFGLGELAKELIATNSINTKEVCLTILSKQWVVVDDTCQHSLLGVLYKFIDNQDFINDLANYSSSNNKKDKERKDRLQKYFFHEITGRDATANDEIQFSRFDAMRNTLLLAGIFSTDMTGKMFITDSGRKILRDFNENEDRLSKYTPGKVDNKEKDFHRHMSSSTNGIFEMIRKDNIELYSQYPNLVAHRSFCLSNFKSNTHYLQRIYYGAPGTGKSHTIKEKEDHGLRCIRTTFHPDSDYSTFVGCYKPHRSNEPGQLTYEFVEQAFFETYRLAWENPQQEIALVIEEINRGNCAQIFGDIFQLLDRDEDGWSTYPIKADRDICDRLREIAIPRYSETMVARYGEDKKSYGFMALPPNMSILATMNTSDQSLFPIDSAFKRRWDWQYIKIAEGMDKKTNTPLGWKIMVMDEEEDRVRLYDWWRFLQLINKKIFDATQSADKQMGYFFAKAKESFKGDKVGRIIKENKYEKLDNISISTDFISAETFVNKVLFYLWTDVLKDNEYEEIANLMMNGETHLSFADFFGETGRNISDDAVRAFLDNVMKEEDEWCELAEWKIYTPESKNTIPNLFPSTPSFKPKSMIIKITEAIQDPEALYERAKGWWRMATERAKKDNIEYVYVYSTPSKIITSCYEVTEWKSEIIEGKEKYGFEGKPIDDDPMIGQPVDSIAHVRGQVVFYPNK